MNITTASGVLARLRGRELAPVEQVGLRDPVPMCGSRTTFTPSRGEAARQLGVQRHRQRVAGHQQVCSGRLVRAGCRAGRGRTPRASPAGTAARGRRGAGARSRPASPRSSSGDSQRSRRAASRERQRVGEPAGRLADREHDVALQAGVHLLARRRGPTAREQHEHDHHERATSARTPSRARKRRARRRRGAAGVGGVGCSASELEVDEGRDALAGHRTRRRQDDTIASADAERAPG